MRIQRYLRPEVLKHGGAVPFRNFKEKNRVINELKREHGQVWFKIEDGFVMYEYKVIC